MDSSDYSKDGSDVDMDSISQKAMDTDNMANLLCSESREFWLGAGEPA